MVPALDADDTALTLTATGVPHSDRPALCRRPAVDGIRVVAAGESVLAASATLIGHDASAPGACVPGTPAPRELDSLTECEQDVLALIAPRLTDAEIAEHLGITVGTVKSHVNAVVRTLGLRDRAQATILAHDVGLARPDRSRGVPS